MLKVLVADKNIEANSNCCQYLANDKYLDIKSAYNGKSLINKYYEVHPDVLVINSNFDDKNYTEIINELSSTSEERNNSNIILTLENKDEQLKLDYAVKIYKIFYSDDVKFEDIKNGITQYNLDHYIFYEPNDKNLTSLFYTIDLFNDFDGADYFKYAIKQCYKNQKLLKSLNNIYGMIAKKFDTSYKSVRPAMRNSLIPVNKLRAANPNKGIFKIFKDDEEITPKVFIETITRYYLKQKLKK